MRTSLARGALTGALFLLSVPASATTYFTIVGLPDAGPRYTFSFSIPDAAVPNPTTSSTARFNGTQITYTRPNSTTPLVETGQFDGPTFFTTIDQGGLAILRLDREPAGQEQFRLFGAQLFTGPTSTPVFRLGTFDLSSTPRNGGDPVQPLTYRLTISDSAAVAVPEPASWAMMICGIGMTGAAFRQRARRSRAAA